MFKKIVAGIQVLLGLFCLFASSTDIGLTAAFILITQGLYNFKKEW
jgi:hypothetical protein